jgi:serine/threonine protein kinase
MIGKIISHYRIIKELGRGGMGVVYKAEDTKLKRIVALKFLPLELTRDPEAKERFILEARAASALDHQNICTIHEINETQPADGEPGEGQLFIVMTCYKGKTLKEKIKDKRLKIKEVIDIAGQIAQGLANAHAKGIVHRDIKPANIFITDEGVVKILDFGLAKLAGPTKLTKTGTTVGTVSYMSPEQARGEKVDHRTDIWSLGVVLYEMATGQLPFKSEYEQAIVYSITNEEPELVTNLRTSVPLELEWIINRALAKKPEERYQNVDDLLVDLKKVNEDLKNGEKTTVKDNDKGKVVYVGRFILPIIILLAIIIVITGYFIYRENKLKKSEDKAISKIEKTVEKKWENSIAVLPFTDMSPKKDQEYFCDGMAEDIIMKLSNIEKLKVISRTSVMRYRDTDKFIKEIGKELGVTAILEGSIRKEKDNIRISAQLSNVEDGFQLWAGSYDRKLESVFDIQREISEKIAEALKMKLTLKEKEHLQKKPTESLEAYNLYNLGRIFYFQRTLSSYQKAIEYFNQAIRVDSNYALAYAGLADTYSWLGFFGFSEELSPHKAFKKAKAAALKALEIDDELVEAITAYAAICWKYDLDIKKAEREIQKALLLNPGYAEAHREYSEILTLQGHYEQSIEEMKHAQILAPVSPYYISYLSWAYMMAHRYNQAIDKAKQAIDMDPDFPNTYFYLGLAYLWNGQHEEGIALLKRTLEKSGTNWLVLGFLGYAYGISGKKNEAKRILTDILNQYDQNFISPVVIANIHAGLDNRKQALDWLERAYEERWSQLAYIKASRFWDNIRTEPRFQALLKKIGLEK